MERPLSAYVMVSVLISILTLYQCSQDLSSVIGCTSNFLYVLMAFSVINILFAMYLQSMVWREIMSEENQDRFVDGDAPTKIYRGKIGQAAMGMFVKGADSPEKQRLPAQSAPENHGRDHGRILVPKDVVQSSFRKVFMEDFGVLFMFFLLLGIFGISFRGHELIDTLEPKCEISGLTANCGFLFFWVAFLWSMMYMCCTCCSNKVTIAKPPEEDYEAVKA